jgi:hypothetical protein
MTENTNHDSRLDFVDYQLYPCFNRVLVAIVTLQETVPGKNADQPAEQAEGRSIIDRQRQGIRGGDDHLKSRVAH